MKSCMAVLLVGASVVGVGATAVAVDAAAPTATFLKELAETK